MASGAWLREQESVLGTLPCGALVHPEHRLAVADPDEPLCAAVRRMWWGQMGALPVLRGDTFLGSVGEQSLLRTVARRLAERSEEEAHGLQVWEDLLRGVSVGDALTPRAELPVVPAETTLLEGLRACRERTGSPTRYLFLTRRDTGPDGPLESLVSLRDMARCFVALYDGRLSADAFATERDHADAREAVRAVLDLAVGEVRRAGKFGHEPVVAPEDLTGREAIRAMWKGGRGYVVCTFPDGAPKGILTRRDVLRVLARPYVDLDRARLANWMSPSVECVRDLDTLCGLLKRMGMEGCRHMPLVDDWDRLECVVSMWDAIWLLASGGTGD